MTGLHFNVHWKLVINIWYQYFQLNTKFHKNNVYSRFQSPEPPTEVWITFITPGQRPMTGLHFNVHWKLVINIWYQYFQLNTKFHKNNVYSRFQSPEPPTEVWIREKIYTMFTKYTSSTTIIVQFYPLLTFHWIIFSRYFLIRYHSMKVCFVWMCINHKLW